MKSQFLKSQGYARAWRLGLASLFSLALFSGPARSQEPASDSSAGAAGASGAASIGPVAPGGEVERLRDTALLGRPPLPKDKPDLLGILKEHAELHRFAELVEAAGLGQSLHGRGPLTVFAPSDKAFRSMPSGMLDELLKDKSRLKRVASYHILRALVPAKKVAILRNALTMSGYVVPIDGEHGLKVGGAQVTDRDQWAKNGVIHVVDSVLLPKEPASSTSSVPKKRKGAEHEGGEAAGEGGEEKDRPATVMTAAAPAAATASSEEKPAARPEPAAVKAAAGGDPLGDGSAKGEKKAEKKSKKKKSKKKKDGEGGEAPP